MDSGFYIDGILTNQRWHITYGTPCMFEVLVMALVHDKFAPVANLRIPPLMGTYVPMKPFLERKKGESGTNHGTYRVLEGYGDGPGARQIRTRPQP
jgi:hypothetical protein